MVVVIVFFNPNMLGGHIPHHTNTRMICCVQACTGTNNANLSKPTACDSSSHQYFPEHGKI